MSADPLTDTLTNLQLKEVTETVNTKTNFLFNQAEDQEVTTYLAETLADGTVVLNRNKKNIINNTYNGLGHLVKKDATTQAAVYDEQGNFSSWLNTDHTVTSYSGFDSTGRSFIQDVSVSSFTEDGLTELPIEQQRVEIKKYDFRNNPLEQVITHYTPNGQLKYRDTMKTQYNLFGHALSTQTEHEVMVDTNKAIMVVVSNYYENGHILSLQNLTTVIHY